MSLTREQIQKEITSALSSNDSVNLKDAIQHATDRNILIDKTIKDNPKLKTKLTPIDLNLVLADSANSINLECLKVLIEAKADINTRAYTLPLLLANAIRNYTPEFVTFLLSSGASVNTSIPISGGYSTPLIYALNQNKFDCAELLIHNKAKVNIPEKSNIVKINKDCFFCLNTLEDYHYKEFTALNVAASKGRLDLVKSLLDAKADINAKLLEVHDDTMLVQRTSLTPLAQAVLINHEAIIQLLLGAKADVLQKNTYQFKEVTALEIAAEIGSLKLVDILLNAEQVQEKAQVQVQKQELPKLNKRGFFDCFKPIDETEPPDIKLERQYR